MPDLPEDAVGWAISRPILPFGRSSLSKSFLLMSPIVDCRYLNRNVLLLYICIHASKVEEENYVSFMVYFYFILFATFSFLLLCRIINSSISLQCYDIVALARVNPQLRFTYSRSRE